MRKTDNKILKKTLLHYINLEYYANGLDEEFQTLLNELQERCISAIESQKSINTKTEYSILYKLIKEEVDKFKKELEERLEEQAEIIMNQELEFLDDVYNKESESEEKGKSSTLAKSDLALGGVSLAKILFSPIDGRDTAKQFAERTGKNILRSYDTPLRAGYLFGQKSEEVTAQVSNQMKQVARGMQSGIRTAIPSFAKTTDRIVFLTNNVEVVWVATLDGHTCIKCASLSGLHFKSVSEAPSVPQHCLCRCQLLPVNSITEPIPTYQEFIESLDEDEQKQVLGANRYEMWKKYEIELKQFVNNGTIVPIEELKKSSEIVGKMANAKTAELVREKYPNMKFASKKISDKATLYVSKKRIKAGVKDPLVYNSDKMMAATLAKETGRDFYMLSEDLVGVANPDGFFIDDTIEMKNVSGSLRRVGLNAVRALRQSPNVFIFVQKDFSIESCLNKIKGAIIDTRQQITKNGRLFIEPNPEKKLLIYTQGKLYEKKWEDVL